MTKMKFTSAILLTLAVAAVESRILESHVSDRKCVADEPLPEMPAAIVEMLKSAPDGMKLINAYKQYQEAGDSLTVGAITEMIAEASDASASGATVEDGKSGDTDFPYMKAKVLATMGERSVCADSMDLKLIGVPDGVGAYLVDDDTVRLVFQSESYGPVGPYTGYGGWSFTNEVNDGSSTMGGSHVQYIDYDRHMMANFISDGGAAADMVVGVGNMINTAYNLKGEQLGPRTKGGPTTTGAHYGNTDADGNYVIPAEARNDWFYMSLCSAHLEEKYQWGDGIGLEDDIFLTVEEWIKYAEGADFVGLGAHAIDLHNKAAYAIGAFSQGGFEKIVEINPHHEGYVMFALSGYTGDFNGDAAIPKRNEAYGPRTDGKDYIWTNNIVPARIYVGVKGKMEDGSDAPEDDFLARNGLRYGKIYGYAVDMKPNKQAKGLYRDEFHRTAEYAYNGARVRGKFIAQKWSWDGTVKNYEHDASWEYQDNPPQTGQGSGSKDFKWWTAEGPDAGGCKTEHLSTDPRAGITGYVQGSTCGYFGHYYIYDVLETLMDSNGDLPTAFNAEYRVYQGELDVRDQIHLGGKGQYVNDTDACMVFDDPESPRVTFEDVDGFEVVEGPEGKLYAIIQEDAGNDYGERMFLAPLEHEWDGKELDYYFLAMSGGDKNTRQLAGVSIPAGTFCQPFAHEFSGVFDLSAFFHKGEDGEYTLKAADTGYWKRKADSMVEINDKQIIVNLQAHSQYCGLLESFQLDRGGQIYMIQPNIPM